MRIVVLGLSSDDVDAELGWLQVAFGDALDAALGSESFDSPLHTLFFTPIVTRPGIGPFPDKLSYLRREPAVNAAVNLSYQRWSEGNRAEHVNMLAEAISRTIDQIKDSKLDRDTKAALRRIVDDVRRSLTDG
jgi:hypothetical protein